MKPKNDFKQNILQNKNRGNTNGWEKNYEWIKTNVNKILQDAQ